MSNEIEKLVLSMLKIQNKPFSVQTVINFTESKFSKPKILLALDELVKSGDVTYMEVGKSGKLYFYN